MLHDLNDLDGWRTITLLTAALGQTAFVFLYLLYPWWKSFLGKALFGKSIALVLIIDFAALSRIFEFGHSDLYFTIMYSVLAIGVWLQFFAFLSTIFGGERDVSGNAEVG